MNKTGSLVLVCVFLAACETPGWGTQAAPDATPTTSGTIAAPTVLPTEFSLPTELPTPTETLLPSQTPDMRLSPEDWQNWPVVPAVSPEMKVLFQHGLALGNNPAAFSKIGDGEISTVWFLTQYDMDPGNYHLGSHTELLPVIEHFSGSFSHVSLAAGRGFDTTIVLGPVLSGTKDCNQGEAHLDCELRIYHPSFAIISLGTNQVWQPEIFEPGLRQIIERLLEAEVVPILSTKADNKEGNFRINTIIAQLAYEYNLPLWNFWRAVQPLPAHGLQPDNEHLTYAYSDFSNPINFQFAWPWRNLTALQVLDSVYQGVSSQP
ncbi:MAG: SGNH/GDSL hydrolase family protein [Anaerolineales bacterium]|jgi:hypothetical protein